MDSEIITAIATQHDAAILTDRDGDIAILARLTGTDGLPVVRHRPDPCDFLPVARWESMTPGQAAAAVC
jgi:hypothetical protein